MPLKFLNNEIIIIQGRLEQNYLVIKHSKKT